eukprot:TRINITY_DN3021_c0_g1_i1.p1 TRINITY_DN3021_c0_g1~~TRINITY_DN3021_c0_g1_i1.p1  ORF type:complete len:533 (+),score=123.49 TRINITY_DN3021_c0_g1_i1:62-1600(+)
MDFSDTYFEVPVDRDQFVYERGLRFVIPYSESMHVHAKGRWIGKSLLSIYSQEFSYSPFEFYQKEIEMGYIRVNGLAVPIDYVVKDNDLITHRIHRHEKPIWDVRRIPIVFRTPDITVVSKPPSMPIHPCGRYSKNTLLSILEDPKCGRTDTMEYETECKPTIDGIDDKVEEGESSEDVDVEDGKVAKPSKKKPRKKSKKKSQSNSRRDVTYRTVNRLDRVTSGLVPLAHSKAAAARLSDLFRFHEIQKVYLARVKGKFPDDGVVRICRRIVLVDHRHSVYACAGHRVGPDGGKEGRGDESDLEEQGMFAATLVENFKYFDEVDESVVICKPLTGRTHQIRLHLQWLGHPIVNDPHYGAMLERSPPVSLVEVQPINETERKYFEEGKYRKMYRLDDEWDGFELDVLTLSKDLGRKRQRARDDAWEGKFGAVTEPRYDFTLSQRSLDLIHGSFQENCPDCGSEVPTPHPSSMMICLHAYKYESDMITCTSPLPSWATKVTFSWEDWEEDGDPK